MFTPIKTPAGVIGLGICYDLRFPELARYEALSGAQIMLYPAAWVKGEGKFMQWETLLRARAIENEMLSLQQGTLHGKKYWICTRWNQIVFRRRKGRAALCTDR